jgi:hypothetical protein
MMKSNDRSDGFDLDRDLPTSQRDVSALRHARTLTRLDLDGYLEFLAQLPPAGAAAARMRRNGPADEPFELTR